jgi:hypothetical protein
MGNGPLPLIIIYRWAIIYFFNGAYAAYPFISHHRHKASENPENSTLDGRNPAPPWMIETL